MLVTCPNCSAHYQVPDVMVGMKGRTMRCSRCQHQWQQPFVATQPEPRARRPEPRMVTDPPRQRAPEPVMVSAFEDPEPIEDDLLAAAMRDEESGDDLKADAGGDGNPFDRIAEMMMEQPPAPVPDLFANAASDEEPRRRRGIFGLIGLVVAIVIVVLAVVAYFLQDRIINRYPAAAQYYDKLDVRNEVVGAGLAFRDVKSERTKQDGNEVLVVRGLIVNTNDQERPIPPLQLVLYDGQNVVQHKVIDPPQAKLDSNGSVGFRITLEQPDPTATRFEVTFAGPKKGGGNAAEPAK
jgi:predicted Zn finger-like uncharacterized protein